MNYPDIETCRAIGGEFKGAEHAYYNGPYNVPTVLKISKDIVWEFLAFAPICEELGERLWDNQALVARTSQNRTHWRLHYPDFDGIYEFEAENETQARAEAVKLILEGKNENKHS